MTAALGAWAFHPHPAAWVVVVALAGAYLWATGREAWRATRHQRIVFLSGCLLLAVALTWPLADLAGSWSLTALVLQRLLLMLAIPPLLVNGLPDSLLGALTRPAPVDAVIRTCSRPPMAVVVVTVVAVGTLTTGAVKAQVSVPAVRGLFDALLVGAGLVLWLPVLGRVPGAARLSVLAKAGYLIVQSIVPSFLSVVWIFARHPLYPSFEHHRVAGLSPLLDQQVAGFVAKLSTIAVLWSVAFVIISRAQDLAGQRQDEAPLTWSDVERQLLRVERRERRQGQPIPTEPPVWPGPGPPTGLGGDGRDLGGDGRELGGGGAGESGGAG